MQTDLNVSSSAPGMLSQPLSDRAGQASAQSLNQYQIIRRNGAVVPFEAEKISVALSKAFIAVEGGQGAASARIREQVAQLTDTVLGALTRRLPGGGGGDGPKPGRPDRDGAREKRGRRWGGVL
jgi:ribonucleoside-diphosphate reductase alpha chain